MSVIYTRYQIRVGGLGGSERGGRIRLRRNTVGSFDMCTRVPKHIGTHTYCYDSVRKRPFGYSHINISIETIITLQSTRTVVYEDIVIHTRYTSRSINRPEQ